MVLVLLTARALIAPPVVVMSLAAKPVGASLKVKVMVAVSPALRALALLVMISVGAVVSAATVEVDWTTIFSVKPALSTKVKRLAMLLFNSLLVKSNVDDVASAINSHAVLSAAFENH